VEVFVYIAGTQYYIDAFVVMDKCSDEETVTLFTEDDELHAGVKVKRLKLFDASAYYRGLASSGMRDAGMLRLTVPDVSNIGLQSVADFIEADNRQVAMPSSLDRLEEVDRNHNDNLKYSQPFRSWASERAREQKFQEANWLGSY